MKYNNFQNFIQENMERFGLNFHWYLKKLIIKMNDDDNVNPEIIYIKNLGITEYEDYETYVFTTDGKIYHYKFIAGEIRLLRYYNIVDMDDFSWSTSESGEQITLTLCLPGAPTTYLNNYDDTIGDLRQYYFNVLKEVQKYFSLYNRNEETMIN